MIFKFKVDQEHIGQRLDKFLADQFSKERPEITRSKIKNLIESGLVVKTSDGSSVSASSKTNLGEEYQITFEPLKENNLVAKDIPFEIIFEDDDLLVINKPAGLTVHPGAGNDSDTLVNALLFSHGDQLSSVAGDFRAGIVHRLDKDTSGLMLVAKNDFTHLKLSRALEAREIKRSYLAFIYGQLNPSRGKIDKNITRHKHNRLKMTVSKILGRKAITHYKTKENYLGGLASMIECKLETGRTHQIRVHLQSIKHSLIGDQTYSSARKDLSGKVSDQLKGLIDNFPRQALHSYKIEFIHPRSEELLTFESKLPADLEELEKCLKEK